MNYKRIFTFGCSFTNWHWPTWADIIAVQTDIPVYNGALYGIGNVGILHKIVEYDLTYAFKKQDLILVMWTGWSREDRYLDHQWTQHGNIFNNDFYDQHFIKKYWSWENDIIKNASAILLANKSYRIASNYSAFEYADAEIGKDIRYATDILKTYIDHLPESIVFDLGQNYRFNNKSLDGHPDIATQVKFYNQHIADKFNFPQVSHNSCFYEWQKDLENNLPQTNIQDQENYIKEYFKIYKNSFSRT